MALRYSLLGPLSVTCAGEQLALGGRKQRTVLAALLTSAGHAVATGTLIDAVWDGNPGDKADATLQVYVSSLRRVLGMGQARDANPIHTAAPGYRIELAGDDELDLQRYRVADERGREAASRGDNQRAAEAFRAALGVWQGDALADLAGVQFAEHFATALDEERMGTVERLLDAELTLGRHVEVLPELAGFTAQFPLRERLQGQHMVALYRAGRQAEALSVYDALRRSLDDELGVLPGPEINTIHSSILNHDDTVIAPSPSRLSDLGLTATVHAVSPFKAALALGDDLIPLGAEPCTIGRNDSCTLTLDDRLVSRVHAEIRAIVGGYLLVDLGSTNGTTVNGAVVRECFLTGGETIGIGAAVLRLVALD